MKIILLTDVPKVGKRWEVKEVSAGFARNHLLAKNLAEAATPAAMAKLQARQTKKESEAEESLQKTQKIASDLDGLEIEIPIKLNDKGEPYRSVSAQMVSDNLKKAGFSVSKKSKIKISKAEGGLGEYPVSISLDHGLEVEIKIILIDENEKDPPAEESL